MPAILISDLEHCARTRKDNISNIRLNRQWLAVCYIKKDDSYRYRWSNNNLTREGATLLLEQFSDTALDKASNHQ